jgi:hypothetical protein
LELEKELIVSAWSHLPNAAHIDQVIESAKTHPEVWSAVRSAATDAVRNAVRNAAWDAVRSAAADAARSAAWEVAWDAVRNAATDASRNAAGDVAGSAILALAAYDDCEHFLEMTSDQLRIWIALSEHPAATLLLPAVIAFEQIKELEYVS